MLGSFILLIWINEQKLTQSMKILARSIKMSCFLETTRVLIAYLVLLSVDEPGFSPFYPPLSGQASVQLSVGIVATHQSLYRTFDRILLTV